MQTTFLFFSAVVVSAAVCQSVGPGQYIKQAILHDDFGNMGKMMTIFRNRIGRMNDRRNKGICYEHLGCFPADRPLKKGPQTPEEVNTKFFLYTRNTSEQLIAYGDDRDSLKASEFKPDRPTKFLVHGFKGSGKDKSALAIASALLNLEDCNVILTDWEKGAAGPSYRLSAANTQLVGRQLTLVLLDLISLGAAPSSIHVIGFSLGAHIAGYAGRSLVKRGIRLSRITGLDPASPLFREQFLSTSMPALSDQDAAFVDVLHTDGAILWTEGFGLLKALGHVDFFPNGGHDQPGCAHVFASVIVSHLGIEKISYCSKPTCISEGTVNSSTVCNHIRAFQLFLESIPPPVENICHFRAFPCLSRDHFRSGNCFPNKCDINSTDGTCGVLGLHSDKGLARGPLYLVTRDNPPFCGDQLQAIATLTRPVPRGLQLIFNHGGITTAFTMHPERAEQARQLVLPRRPLLGSVTYRGLAAAPFGTTPISLNTTSVTLTFRHKAHYPGIAYVRVNSIDGHSWSFCGKEDFTDFTESTEDKDTVVATVELKLGLC